MNVKEVKSEGLKREFVITIPAAEIQTSIDKKLQDIGRTAKIPGFRPGKIPANILKQRYGDSVKHDALQQAAQDNVIKVLDDKKLKAAMRPDVKLSDYEDGKDLTCEVKIEIMPEIKAPDYSKLKLERLVTEPTDADIKKSKEDLANSFNKTEEVKEARAIKTGDILSLDLKTFSEGKEITEAAAKDYLVELGKKMMPEDVEKALVGKKVGDVVKVDITFPDGAQPEYAGKKGQYEATIKQLRKKATVKLDDTFAKELGYKDVKELDEDIAKRLKAKYVEESFIYTKRKVLDELAKLAKFDVPQGMVESEFQSIWGQLQKELEAKGEKKDDKKLEKEYRAIAERRVRLGLLLGEIGRSNKIEVPEKMIHQELATRARQYPGQEREVVDYYMKTPEAMASLRAPLFENLVIQHIVEKAEVKDKKVTSDQLTKEVDQVIKDSNDEIGV